MNTFIIGIKNTFSPKRIAQELIELKGREKLLLAAMIGATALAFIFGGINASSTLQFVLGIVTAINLILVDRGRLTNYSWGLASTVVWLLIALNNRLIGDIASQSYYFVMQFIGIYMWQKAITNNKDNENKEVKEVAPKSISKLQASGAIALAIIVYVIVLATSHHLHGSQIYLDSTLLPLAIVSQLLMTYGYKSQWIGWILIDIVNVIIWIKLVQSGGMQNLSMLALQIVMLINAIYGAYVWNRK